MSQSFWGTGPADEPHSAAQRSLGDAARQLAADPLLAGAVASMGLALGLQLAGRTKAARFVGLWAPTLLLLGLYQRTTSRSADEEQQRRQAAALDLERRFEGGCASPPAEWEESIDDGYRMTAARDIDDYSERISRTFPHKAK